VIQRVKIDNFRGLQQVDVQLRPLTVLVGPNDSGKTSFLEAIERCQRNDFKREDGWRHTGSAQVTLFRDADDAHSRFSGSIELFRLPSAGIPMESTGIADRTGAPQLAMNGQNLAAYLDYLLRKDRQRFDQIQQTLRPLVPGFEEIRISTPAPETRSVSFLIEGQFEIPGEGLSTGVRILLFFTALAYHPNPPQVALIEEPETGVHPQRLKDIVELLRSLTAGRLGGREVQVILTTHSPYLLDHVRLPEDQVIVFRRERDGRRSATEADENRLKEFLNEFLLGEVWFNRGEEGLLKAAAQ
jgi:predicted ATPase